jgi:hypothetical protein
MLENKVPRVQYSVCPSDSVGKVIQVRFQGLDYLFIGSFGEGIKPIFHKDHLISLLNQFGITEILTFIDRGGLKCPVQNTREYKLIGAGNCQFISEKEHEFYGSSSSYQIKINEPSLLNLVKFFPNGINVTYNDLKGGRKNLGIGEGVKE